MIYFLLGILKICNLFFLSPMTPSCRLFCPSGNLASYTDILRLVMHSSPQTFMGRNAWQALRPSAWEAMGNLALIVFLFSSPFNLKDWMTAYLLISSNSKFGGKTHPSGPVKVSIIYCTEKITLNSLQANKDKQKFTSVHVPNLSGTL